MHFEIGQVALTSLVLFVVGPLLTTNIEAVMRALGLDRMLLGLGNLARRVSGRMASQPWFWPSVWVLSSAMLASSTTVGLILWLGAVKAR